jgi:hypothetical protein
MIIATGRLLGIPVTPQVRADYGEFARQCRSNLEPGQVREWIAVHQQNRRPFPADNGHDAGPVGPDFGSLKSVEHGRAFSVLPRLFPAFW